MINKFIELKSWYFAWFVTQIQIKEVKMVREKKNQRLSVEKRVERSMKN